MGNSDNACFQVNCFVFKCILGAPLVVSFTNDVTVLRASRRVGPVGAQAPAHHFRPENT